MKTRHELSLLLLASAMFACADDNSSTDSFNDSLTTNNPDGGTEAGDGDGDSGDGDGDGDDDPTSGDGDGDGDPTGDGDGDGEPPVDACGFELSAVEWPLPQDFSGVDPFDRTADYHACNGGGEYRYQVLEMTGDGAVDFLVTDACGQAGVGFTNWQVFESDGSGFAAQPITWPLPQYVMGNTQFLEQLSDYWSCGASRFRYQLLDMTGDGAVDFLVTDACDAGGVGKEGWLVHENTGNGFAEDPMVWSLPQYLAGDVEFYENIADYWSCNADEFRYQLIDMTGDGAVDFLVTDACDALGAGASHWLVHENTGDGFAEQPIEWELPKVFADVSEIYEQTADYWPCNGGEFRYQLLDMTGDGAVDFLITDACDATGVGATSWQVLENTGTGFSGQPIIWSLPNPFGGAEIFENTADYWPCDIGDFRFTTIDVTGDRAPDLVVTDACDAAGVGSDRWDVFENTGDSFAEQPTNWPLPTYVVGDDLHEQFADNWPCDSDDYRYEVFDLNGDGAPDFVATDLCDYQEVGTTHWSLFAATCE